MTDSQINKSDNGYIEVVLNQPTLLDLVSLVESVAKLNNPDFTKAVASALHKVANPAMRFMPAEKE